MMLAAAVCSLWATVLWRVLCSLAADSLQAEPGLPTATPRLEPHVHVIRVVRPVPHQPGHRVRAPRILEQERQLVVAACRRLREAYSRFWTA